MVTRDILYLTIDTFLDIVVKSSSKTQMTVKLKCCQHCQFCINCQNSNNSPLQSPKDVDPVPAVVDPLPPIEQDLQRLCAVALYVPRGQGKHDPR